jgi:hypothetical protein
LATTDRLTVWLTAERNSSAPPSAAVLLAMVLASTVVESLKVKMAPPLSVTFRSVSMPMLFVTSPARATKKSRNDGPPERWIVVPFLSMMILEVIAGVPLNPNAALSRVVRT